LGRKQFIALAGIGGALLLLGLLGGRWSSTQAYMTVPTESAPTAASGGGSKSPEGTALPGDLAGRFSDVECTAQEITPKEDFVLDFLYYPETKSLKLWGGVSGEVGAACQEARLSLCGVPVRYAPKRSTLNFYRPVMQVSQYVEGTKDVSPACGSLDVYFDLTQFERFMYDHYPEQFGFYQYDPSAGAWKACSRMRLDNSLSDNGRLTCSTTGWGYFALGWPAQ
jgi:hypothetical protein